MSGIRRKSSIAQTAEIVLAAHEQGEPLLWERYERQLPLCGFTINGLNCRKCFNGPCRINPFGDEPSRGVCGADRDQIVMENLFCATLEGVLETARTMALARSEGFNEDLPDVASDLPLENREKLTQLGLLPVRMLQLLEVQNSHFSQKGYLLKTLMDLTRLGLIQYGFLKKAEASLCKLPRDNPSFSPEGRNILIVGQVPLGLLLELQNQANRRPKGKVINLFIKGANGLSPVETLVDHGSAELALTMNLDALIIAPNAYHPALENLAQRFGIPSIRIEENKAPDQIASQTIEHAIHHAQNASYVTSLKMVASPPQSAQSRLFGRQQEVKAALKEGRLKGIVVILGEASVKQTFFERTLALIERSLEQKCLVLLGGELGCQTELLNRELAKNFSKKNSSQSLPSEINGLPYLNYFGSFNEIPNVVAFLRDLAQGKGFETIPAVVAFPEFFRASTWATVVSFLSLGFAVQIGTRLPFWGSPSLTNIIIKDWPKISGGLLMTSPDLPDSQTQAQELFSFLEARKA